MDSQRWNALNVLKGEIHDKCVYYEYIDQEDTSLADFIVDIIQMGKSSEEVSAELSAYQNLTQWMFARLEELNKPVVSTEIHHNESETNGHTEDNNMNSTTALEPITTTEEEAAASERRKARKNRMFTKALTGLGERQSSHQQHQQQDSSMYRTSTIQRPALNREQHGDHYYRHERGRPRSRSRSRSPIRQKERIVHREMKKDSIFSRLGKPSNESPNGSPSVFDRLGISKPETVNDESEVKRCKFWPSCDKGEYCPFFHPDTLCPDFPNCPKKANECMFIHPQTPQKKQRPITDSTLTEKAIPCRYFPHCNNDQCPYFHPPAVPSFYEPYPTFSPYPTYPSYPSAPKRVPVPCKNGEHCTRPDCHFLHPKDENPNEIICKFDGACTRPGCFYKHTAQSTVEFGKPHNKSLVVNHPTKSERGFAITDDNQVEKMTVGESADLIKQQPQDVEMDS
ncbi:uncharacterized protein BX664DRAFT_367170 [Halteromyces radiatus]|uniref:uncharacterized protein n=1 Tax=Halteromyces radiatus TaxID=101107 RepID=UPI002220AF2B|nr:uncharacterized protein BX664DRAFT_367170 [Halteromyces radiatus]KAI8078755.1 hypothetical protein BX664DRAFT_367170 [Halteromyces radiatus]